jgi:hypothetical protein
MAMAANGVFQWGANGAGASFSPPAQAVFSPPVLPAPRDVARALFAELGLDCFICAPVTPHERLIRDIEIFAAGAMVSNPAAGGVKPAQAQAPAQARAQATTPRAAPGLFASAPRVPAQAGPAREAMPQPADDVSPGQGDVMGMAKGVSGLAGFALTEAEAAPAMDKAEMAEAQGWLGLDMSQPREWSADDLAMLMFCDRAAAADSLTRRAEQAAIKAEEGLGAYIDPDAFGDDASEENAFEAQAAA